MKSRAPDLSGKKLAKTLSLQMCVTATMGIPIAQVLWVFLICSNLTGLQPNMGKWSKIILFSFFAAGTAMVLHSIYIYFISRETRAFLEKPYPSPGESPESFRQRLLGALDCSLRLPILASVLSLLTWPSVILVISLVMNNTWMELPMDMMVMMFLGAFLTGLLVMNVQYYTFKKTILAYQQGMLLLLPDYWQVPLLRRIRISLRAKLTVNLVSLVLVFLGVFTFISRVEGIKAVLFQWASTQKQSLAKTVSLLDPQKYQQFLKKDPSGLVAYLQQGSKEKLFLFDRKGAHRVGTPQSPRQLELLSAAAKKDYSFDSTQVLVPHWIDNNIATSYNKETMGTVLRLELPDSPYVVLAFSSADQHALVLSQLNVNTSVALVVALLCGILFALMASRDIAGSIQNMGRIAQKVGQGDLVIEERLVAHDELGLLALDVASMISSLRNAVLGLKDATIRIDHVSNTISERVNQASDGSKLQRSAVEETGHHMDEINSATKDIKDRLASLAKLVDESSRSILQILQKNQEVASTGGELDQAAKESAKSIEHMSNLVTDVAQNMHTIFQQASEAAGSLSALESSFQNAHQGIEETAQVSKEVAASASDGKKHVQTTIEGIEGALASSKQAVTTIETLARQVQDIGQIAAVITSVTDQTNLLALNAAIIAAQAGEHGRGFSVVAAEIKALAERTSQSTSEIRALIVNIQKQARQAVEIVQLGYQAVADGADLSRRAGHYLGIISENAQRSQERTEQVSRIIADQIGRTQSVVQFVDKTLGSIRLVEEASRQQSLGTRQVQTRAKRIEEAAGIVRQASMQQQTASQSIIGSMDSINQLIGQIQGQLDHQVDNTDHVVDSMQQVLTASQETQEGSRAMVESAANLKQLSGELGQVVETFKLGTES